MKSTVQIMLVIIVPNQMLNMNTQWSFFFFTAGEANSYKNTATREQDPKT